MSWRLTVMSKGIVLFTADMRSRRECEELAAEAWRLRPDVKIFMRPPADAAVRADPRQLELNLKPPR